MGTSMLSHAWLTRLLERYYKPWSDRRRQARWHNIHLQSLLQGIRAHGRDGLYRTQVDLLSSDVDHLVKLLRNKGYQVAVQGRDSKGYFIIINY